MRRKWVYKDTQPHPDDDVMKQYVPKWRYVPSSEWGPYGPRVDEMRNDIHTRVGMNDLIEKMRREGYDISDEEQGVDMGAPVIDLLDDDNVIDLLDDDFEPYRFDETVAASQYIQHLQSLQRKRGRDD